MNAPAPARPAPLVQSESFLQPLGRSLIIAFYATAQSMRIYPLENATVQKALDELYRIVRRVLDREGSLDLRLVGDFLFLNDARLRLDLSEYVSFSYLSGMIRRHGIGRIEIGAETAREHLAAFISLLLKEGRGEEADFHAFEERLRASTARGVVIEPARERDEQPRDDDSSREAAKLTYFQSVAVAKEVLTDARLGRAVNLRRVKRAVQSIVDQVLNNESSIVGMTALRDYDEYTFTHSVNVCIFSVVLGQKLGLSKVQLYELGLGALFHDIGKQRVAPEIINKPAALDEAEWEAVQQHPTEGLLMLFSMRGLSEMPYRAMLMAYEHHMKRDLSGYPRNRRPRDPTLFSRVVAAADGFDAATSKRSYNQQPWPPDEVLREMRENPQRGFDPLLVKALINVTGVFPVGTLAILDTQELAVVTARNPDPAKIHQPIVKIISNEMGIMIANPQNTDLAEVDPATGRQRRTIIKTTQPEKYGIRISDYFV
jgi:HD-GYP domain-containing protein (c-di-GMP phosphodiesterase class II)